MKNKEMKKLYKSFEKKCPGMKDVCKDLVDRFSVEELLVLKFMLDEQVRENLHKMNLLMEIKNVMADAQASTTAVVQVPVTPVTPAPIAQTPVVQVVETPVTPVTTEQAAETFIEEVKKTDDYIEEDDMKKNNDMKNVIADTKSVKSTKNWYTEMMIAINKFDPKTRLYKEFTTDKEGVLYCITSNLDPSLLGGQLGHNGKIYNFIFSTKFELPVVLGAVSLDYLKSIKDEILAKAPETFVEAEKLGTKYMNEYGYGGRFYYDELEEGSFIFKTKDGYKGFTQGMSFRIAIDEDTDEERIYTLKNGFFFSQNYENAQSKRQMRLYPNLVEDIKVLVSKVDERFMNYREYEQATKDDSTKVEDSSTEVKDVKDVPERKGRSRFTGLFDM